MNEVVLTGLDGSNPLGFMAALGVLEALTDQGMAVTLGWREDGAWRPVVRANDLSVERLLALLEQDRLTCSKEPALALEYGGTRDLKPPPAVFRQYLLELAELATPERRRSVDWASAFATDVAVDNNGNTKPTALHFTAGTQAWLVMVLKLRDEVQVSDFEEALFGPWRYERTLPVMRWDSTVSRDYALRASNPSSDKSEGIPGADWLAVRGLPCIQVVPEGRRALTTGCTGDWKTTRFTWPLWDLPLGRPVIRSLLRIPRIAQLGVAERGARGITQVFECGIKRADQGGRGSFTPASVL